MPRFDLNVPKGMEKTAQSMGAVWDDASKTWYVPDGVNPTPLELWMPYQQQVTELNVRGPSFFLAQSHVECHSCQEITDIVAIVVDVDHEMLEEPEEEGAPLEGVAGDTPAFARNVHYLSTDAKSVLTAASPHFRLDRSHTAEDTYWMNHCSHCDAKLGDFYLHGEVGGGFATDTKKDRAAITLVAVARPVTLEGDLRYEDMLGEMMP